MLTQFTISSNMRIYTLPFTKTAVALRNRPPSIKSINAGCDTWKRKKPVLQTELCNRVEDLPLRKMPLICIMGKGRRVLELDPNYKSQSWIPLCPVSAFLL